MQETNIALIFMTYIPSRSLEDVWQHLDSEQKASVRYQLQAILTDLRSISYDGRGFGGVAGEGCKDLRRHLRKSDPEKPVKTHAEF